MRNVDLLQEQHMLELLESVDVSQLATKLVADDRSEQDHHHTNEVGGVDNVQLLQVLLVPGQN